MNFTSNLEFCQNINLRTSILVTLKGKGEIENREMNSCTDKLEAEGGHELGKTIIFLTSEIRFRNI